MRIERAKKGMAKGVRRLTRASIRAGIRGLMFEVRDASARTVILQAAIVVEAAPNAILAVGVALLARLDGTVVRAADATRHAHLNVSICQGISRVVARWRQGPWIWLRPAVCVGAWNARAFVIVERSCATTVQIHPGGALLLVDDAQLVVAEILPMEPWLAFGSIARVKSTTALLARSIEARQICGQISI